MDHISSQRPVVDVVEAAFGEEVLKSELPVLVAFWAPWSRPCRILDATLGEVAVAAGGRLKVVRINADDHPELSLWYDIQSLPTLLFFVTGHLRAKTVGTASKTAILSRLHGLSPEGGAPPQEPAPAGWAKPPDEPPDAATRRATPEPSRRDPSPQPRRSGPDPGGCTKTLPAMNTSTLKPEPVVPPRRYSASRTRHRVNFFCDAPQAESVRIVGDFNGWDLAANPMHRTPDGRWMASLELHHGHHRYWFVVDGIPALDPRAAGVARLEGGKPASLVAVS